MLLAATVIADLCGPVPVSTDPVDAVESRSYSDVGDDARTHDDARIAATAYRKALELDPGNAHAREALAALCRSAVAVDDDGELLAAIAQYQRGDLTAAAIALRAIAARGGRAAAGAHFFAGLIALRHHDGEQAVTDFEAARKDPAYSELADSMLRLARRDGAIAAMLVVQNELDTNPALLPDTPPVGATTGPRQTDDDLLLLGTVTARPWRWLWLRDVLAWRKQVTLTSLDFFGETAQIGVELGEGRDRVALRYDFDDDLLDGNGYLVASRGTVAVRHELEAVTLSAGYALRRRDYLQTAEAPFTGWVHEVDASATFHVTPRFDLEAGAVAWRELAADPVFANDAAGARLAAHALLGGRTRFAAAASAYYAGYAAAEPDGILRDDLHGEATADVEIDLGDHVFAIAGASVLGNRSTVEDFRYWKLVARFGIAVALGGP